MNRRQVIQGTVATSVLGLGATNATAQRTDGRDGGDVAADDEECCDERFCFKCEDDPDCPCCCCSC
jgi:hypothetical protein